MQVDTLPLQGAMHFHLNKLTDYRGWFTETFRQSWMDLHIPNTKFIFEFCSMSIKTNTIRGLHAQTSQAPQAKLVSVLKGKIQDVLVDARVNSPTFGQTCSVLLDENNPSFVYIPRGFYHGFITLEPNTIVQYKTDNYHNAAEEVGVMYNDPTLHIDWKITSSIILSQRDQNHPNWDNAYKFTDIL